MNYEEIFDAVKTALPVSETAHKLWIAQTKPVRFEGNTAFIYTSDPYEKGILEKNFIDRFNKTFEEVMGFEVEVKVLCRDDLSVEQKARLGLEGIAELQDDEKMLARLDEAEKRGMYGYTFDSFIVGESNRLAFVASRSVTQGQSGKYNPLYIYSEPGLGKTHLLSAVYNEQKKLQPDSNIIFVPAEKFVADFVNSLSNGTNEEFTRLYRSADLLLVDDVQFVSGKKESQFALFHTFNDLHQRNKQIIFTSDRPPKEIIDLEPRLRSRFEWGLLADISTPEFETRVRIIRRKAELLGMTLFDNIIDYIADKIRNNIRQLEGAISKINVMAEVTGTAPTLVMAQNIVKEILTETQSVPVTVDKIIAEVASIYNVTPEEIRGQNRSAQISTARQIAIYVVHKITGISYTSIGQEFGGRDHSTIVYAINKVKTILKRDSSYRATVEDLIKNIGSLRTV